MNEDFSSSNISFTYLKNSPGFLNAILNDVLSAIILLNKKMELIAFKDPMRNLFIESKDEAILYERCGNVIGCAYTIDEKKDCGNTSMCKLCDLRINSLIAYESHKSICNKSLSREFYTKDLKKVMRHFRYSTRSFLFEDEYYILVIINDITKLQQQNELILKQTQRISDLESTYSEN